MAATLFTGMSVSPQHVWPHTLVGGAQGNVGLNGPDDKCAYIGRVWFPSRSGMKQIEKVGFLVGNTSRVAGGSGLRVSLQDLVTAGVSTARPDEVQDEAVNVPNSDIPGTPTGGWVETDALSALRTVTYGELLAVVVEYDATGQQTDPDTGLVDQISLAGFRSNTNGRTFSAIMRRKAGSSWLDPSGNSIPSVTLEFSDGTSGTLWGSFLCSTIGGSAGIETDSLTSDEAGLYFKMPRDVYVDGVEAFISFGFTDADGEFCLYQGSELLTSVAFDAHQQADEDGLGTTSTSAYRLFPAAVHLTAGTIYRLTVRATTTRAITLGSVTVHRDSHMPLLPYGRCWKWTQRLAGGAWTDTALRRPLVFPLFGGR